MIITINGSFVTFALASFTLARMKERFPAFDNTVLTLTFHDNRTYFSSLVANIESRKYQICNFRGCLNSRFYTFALVLKPAC